MDQKWTWNVLKMDRKIIMQEFLGIFEHFQKAENWEFLELKFCKMRLRNFFCICFIFGLVFSQFLVFFSSIFDRFLTQFWSNFQSNFGPLWFHFWSILNLFWFETFSYKFLKNLPNKIEKKKSSRGNAVGISFFFLVSKNSHSPPLELGLVALLLLPFCWLSCRKLQLKIMAKTCKKISVNATFFCIVHF